MRKTNPLLVGLMILFAIFFLGKTAVNDVEAQQQPSQKQMGLLTVSGRMVNVNNKSIPGTYTIVDSASGRSAEGRELFGRFKFIMTTYGVYYVTFHAEHMSDKTVKVDMTKCPLGSEYIFDLNVMLYPPAKTFQKEWGQQYAAIVYYNPKTQGFAYYMPS